MNKHLKKGMVLMAVVFILFIAGIIELYRISNTVLRFIGTNRLDLDLIWDSLDIKDLSILSCLVMIFIILWLYSIIDAFIAGRRIDLKEEQGHP